jgi:hypothetical protein
VQRVERDQLSTITIRDVISMEHVIPVERLLAFTYQRDRLIVVNPVEVSSSMGDGRLIIIDLPFAAKMTRPGVEMRPVRFQLE